MSLASDYAGNIATQDEKIRAAEALVPPGCTLIGLSATVSRDGGLDLDRKTTLSPEDALRLGQWIVATFG